MQSAPVRETVAVDAVDGAARTPRRNEHPNWRASRARVLIADDQPDLLKALRLLLKPEGYQITEVMSPAGIVAELESQEFDVLLMDLNYARDTTSGREALDLLPRVMELD